MKTINKIFAIAMAALPVFASCTEEKIEVGGPENDSYGVYFETLTAAQKTVVLDPADETVLTFTARRTEEDDDIVVPIVLTANDGKNDASDLFVVSEILFKEGQTETKFEVSFPNTQVGVTYNCSIECTSPRYVYLYSTSPNYISFNVTREKWSPVKAVKGSDGKDGIALWRDDFITTAYNVPTNAEYEVEVYENDANPGLYRFKNVYGAAYPYNEPGDYDDSKDYWVYIDATNPNKVYIPDPAPTGCVWNQDYGEFILWSLAGYYLARGGSATAYYGTLVDGVIKFPTDALMLGVNDGYYRANTNGMFRVILPGAKDSDYTFGLSSGVCANAKVPVSFTLGTDVAKVLYKVFEGTISSGDLPIAVAEIVADKDALTVTETSVVDVACEKTGKYTLVGVAFDAEGKKVAEATTTFGYVAAGDEEANATVVTAGLELTSRYEAAGYNRNNSVQFYVYGEDLVDLKMELLKSDSKDLEDLEALVAKLESEAAEDIEKANDIGYSDLYVGLDPLTSYTLVVYAFNGYTSKIVTAEITTEGLPLKKLGTGDYTSLIYINQDDSPYVFEDLELWFDPNTADNYLIPDWCTGSTFKFTFDPATGAVEVPLQSIDLQVSGFDVYAVERNAIYNPASEEYKQIPLSSYDAKTHTFTFSVAYIALSAAGKIVGKLVEGSETFVTDVEFAAGGKDASKTQSVRTTKKIEIKSLSRFAGIDAVPSVKSASFSVAGQRGVNFNETVEFSKNAKAIDGRLIVK